MIKISILIKAQLLLLTIMTASILTRAQTTIPNVDDYPIAVPQEQDGATQMWQWVRGADVGGCSNGPPCHAHGNLSPDTIDHNLDGASLQFDLINNGDGCTDGCYTDIYFFNRVIRNSSANNATSFTLEKYLTVDDVTNSVSQAIEFTVEQDVQSDAVTWKRYVYSMQCDFVTTHHWRVWDGALNGGAADWTDNYQGINGGPYACLGFGTAGTFTHLVFHFQRPDLDHMFYPDFYIDGNYMPINYLANVQTKTNWEDQLIAALQLDSDSLAHSYTVWADTWSITYQ